MYDPKESVFYLKDTHKTGGPDHAICFAPGGVEARVWPERAIGCSLCYDGRDRDLRKRAIDLFDSVRPETSMA